MMDPLQETRRALDRTTADMEAFLHSVTHDLRAPLRAIEGFSVALMEDLDAGRKKEARDDAARVVVAARRLDAMMSDLLSLARAGRHEPHMVDVDVSAVASTVVGRVRAADPDRSVTWRIQEGMRARGDPDLVAVVLDALIENAWKFTAPRPHATVEVGFEATPRGQAFFVRDDGVGFDAAFQEKLFAPFQRLHGKEFPGNGIGLATVRRVLNSLDGQAWATGEAGKGATIYFTLPPAREAPS